MRAIASRGLFAWNVVIEPSWPVFMACKISSGSSLRTSPTMMRFGRMRRLLITSCRCMMAPLPSAFGRTAFQPYHVPLLQLQFSRVLNGDDPLLFGDVAGEHIQHRRLTGAGPAGHNNVETGFYGATEQLQHRFRQRRCGQQIAVGDWSGPECPN